MSVVQQMLAEQYNLNASVFSVKDNNIGQNSPVGMHSVYLITFPGTLHKMAEVSG